MSQVPRASEEGAASPLSVSITSVGLILAFFGVPNLLLKFARLVSKFLEHVLQFVGLFQELLEVGHDRPILHFCSIPDTLSRFVRIDLGSSMFFYEAPPQTSGDSYRTHLQGSYGPEDAICRKNSFARRRRAITRRPR
jgi:hypothetical protein